MAKTYRSKKKKAKLKFMEKVTIFLFCDALLQLLSPSRSIQGAGIGVKGSIWDIYGPKSAKNIKKENNSQN